MCLLALPLLSPAQRADTVIQNTPEQLSSAEGRFALQGLRLGLDVVPWISGLASPERTLYNLHMRLDAGRGDRLQYGASLNWLRSEAVLSSAITTYQHSGQSLSLGLYLNVIPTDPDHNLVTIGLGYGRSWFDETLSGVVEDPRGIYGDSEVNRSSTGLRSGWFSLSGGMQARIWKQLYTGYNLSLKLLPHFSEEEQLQIYEVPGYGRASAASSFEFSYYLLYRIPFSRSRP
ncbi:DUF6048 family protein [Cesiribacter andamanensis]|uniref:Outer membrane protein beta-barrel domain-containing protein n=1 Tax=Cesiribacter andamanensis AMV16 TaxID=1279009 RepID=M7MYC1_9BACT|nr:DUF6048 family protein [Cesiribacter andamanensis]EMR01443.1 hypothetical protein ADICEAN_03429 [Cesiribacter andamanensis AMV16]